MPNEGAGSCEVRVQGKVFRDMLSMNLRRSRNEGTAVGTIVMSWPGAEHMNVSGLLAKEFMEGQDGEIYLDKQLAAKIIFDTRISKGTPKSYELTLNFRGKASTPIDSSVKHDTGQFDKQTPMQIGEKLLKDSGVKLINQSGSEGKPLERFIVAYGETVERALRRAARDRGLTFFENEKGDWVMMGANFSGWTGGGELRVGRDFVQWTTKRNLGPRYPEEDIQASGIPDQKKWGKEKEADPFGTEIRNLIPGSVAGILPAGRFRATLVDSDHDKDTVKDFKEFQASRAASQGLDVTLVMSTWVNDGGTIWMINQKYKVVIPIDEINTELVISQVEFELTPDSRKATITLVSPDGTGGSGAPAQPGETSWEFGTDQKVAEQPQPEQPEPAPEPEPPKPSEEEPPKEQPVPSLAGEAFFGLGKYLGLGRPPEEK